MLSQSPTDRFKVPELINMPYSIWMFYFRDYIHYGMTEWELELVQGKVLPEDSKKYVSHLGGFTVPHFRMVRKDDKLVPTFFIPISGWPHIDLPVSESFDEERRQQAKVRVWSLLVCQKPALTVDFLVNIYRKLGISWNFYDLAVHFNRMDLYQYMYEKDPEALKASLKKGNYSALTGAACNGFLQIFNAQIELFSESDQVNDILMANDFSIFHEACYNNRPKFIKRIVELAPKLLPKILAYDNYFFFNLACRQGHYDVAQLLMKLAEDKAEHMLYARISDSFHSAVVLNHVEVVNFLAERIHANVLQELIEKSFTSASDEKMISYLLSIVPQKHKMPAVIAANDFYMICNPYTGINKMDILLSFPGVFVKAMNRPIQFDGYGLRSILQQFAIRKADQLRESDSGETIQGQDQIDLYFAILMFLVRNYRRLDTSYHHTAKLNFKYLMEATPLLPTIHKNFEELKRAAQECKLMISPNYKSKLEEKIVEISHQPSSPRFYSLPAPDEEKRSHALVEVKATQDDENFLSRISL